MGYIDFLKNSLKEGKEMTIREDLHHHAMAEIGIGVAREVVQCGVFEIECGPRESGGLLSYMTGIIP
jgi:hypothetical protein